MQTFRKDVASLIFEFKTQNEQKEQKEEMTLDEFKSLMKLYRAELQDNDCGKWSEEARDWAIESGMIEGVNVGTDGLPNYAWADFLTREQAVTLFYRFAKLMGAV